MKVRHVELAEANAFVERLHRHHKTVVGHRFSLGAFRGEDCVGVAIIGRPVARKTDQRYTVEVLRLCTDGTPNACSFLYAAGARAAAALGYRRIQTFILASEIGTSLHAAGWIKDGDSVGGNWNNNVRHNRRTDQPMTAKHRYARVLE